MSTLHSGLKGISTTSQNENICECTSFWRDEASSSSSSIRRWHERCTMSRREHDSCDKLALKDPISFANSFEFREVQPNWSSELTDFDRSTPFPIRFSCFTRTDRINIKEVEDYRILRFYELKLCCDTKSNHFQDSTFCWTSTLWISAACRRSDICAMASLICIQPTSQALVTGISGV